MNVLYISDGSDKFGAPKALIEILKEIKEKKYDINPIVLTSKYNGVNKFCEENNIENYVTKQPSFMMTKKENFLKFIVKFVIKFIRYIVFSKISIHEVEKKIDLTKIDLIHTNTTIINLGAELSKKYKIKHYWHIREFGQKDYDFISFKRNYINYMNKYTYKFFAISDAIKKCWIDKGIEKKKIQLLYDGIDLSDIEYKNETNNIPADKIKIVFSGYISENKGQIQAIQALSLMPKDKLNRIQIDIIGTGKPEYVDFLNKEIKSKNLEDNVKLLGYKDNLRQMLKNYQIGLMCSKSEGFGRTTVEYMASGLLVIASDTGANIELINNNIDGIIYEYNNIKELKEKIEYVLDNQSLINKISANAHKKVCERFGIERNVREIITNYEKNGEE